MLPFMRILVVEDDPKIASFVANGLKQSGYAVDHFADGEEALFHAQSISYDATVGDLTMDLLTRNVQRGNREIELQPREFALLEYLMRHPNRPVTKTMILEHIFDYSFDPQTNVVDVLIHRLRGKVDKEKAMIHT